MINYNDYIKLVYFIYDKYFTQYDYIKEDLCQEGFLALWKASKQFNKINNANFSTHAVELIKNSMYEYVKKENLNYTYIIKEC